jgi:hypothetical protein
LITALQKEREFGELKSRFVAMISHEFRTPLASIQTASDILLHYRDRLSDEERQRRLLEIQAEVRGMTELLEDILLFGRTEAGKLDFQPEQLRLDGLCRELGTKFSEMTPRREIRFQIPESPVIVTADRRLMQYVVSNLLSNARKYSPEDQPIQVGLEDAHDCVRLSVVDRGIGIPSQDLDRLFEPFERASNVGQRQGTGLGLAIIKMAVDLHNGEITVVSTPGAGSAFTVTLPRERTIPGPVP